MKLKNILLAVLLGVSTLVCSLVGVSADYTLLGGDYNDTIINNFPVTTRLVLSKKGVDDVLTFIDSDTYLFDARTMSNYYVSGISDTNFECRLYQTQNFLGTPSSGDRVNYKGTKSLSLDRLANFNAQIFFTMPEQWGTNLDGKVYRSPTIRLATDNFLTNGNTINVTYSCYVTNPKTGYNTIVSRSINVPINYGVIEMPIIPSEMNSALFALTGTNQVNLFNYTIKPTVISNTDDTPIEWSIAYNNNASGLVGATRGNLLFNQGVQSVKDAEAYEQYLIDYDTDFSLLGFLTDAWSVLNTPLFGEISIGGILSGAVALGLLIAFLKIFAGG